MSGACIESKCKKSDGQLYAAGDRSDVSCLQTALIVDLVPLSINKFGCFVARSRDARQHHIHTSSSPPPIGIPFLLVSIAYLMRFPPVLQQPEHNSESKWRPPGRRGDWWPYVARSRESCGARGAALSRSGATF